MGKLATQCFKYTYIIVLHKTTAVSTCLWSWSNCQLRSALLYFIVALSIISLLVTKPGRIEHTWLGSNKRQSPCLFAWTIFSFTLTNVSPTCQIQFFFHFSNTQSFSCKYLMEVSLTTRHNTGYTAVLQQCLKVPSRVFSKCNQPRTHHPDSDGSWARVSKSHKTMYNHSSERSVYGTKCCTYTGSKFSFSNMKTLQKHCMLKTQQLNTPSFLLFT